MIDIAIKNLEGIKNLANLGKHRQHTRMTMNKIAYRAVAEARTTVLESNLPSDIRRFLEGRLRYSIDYQQNILYIRAQVPEIEELPVTERSAAREELDRTWQEATRRMRKVCVEESVRLFPRIIEDRPGA